MAKILIVRLGAMGDILHALPVVTGIRQAMPQATIDWVVEERWSELLEVPSGARQASAASPKSEHCSGKPALDTIHKVNTLRWRKAFWSPRTGAEVLSALQAIRKAKYDLALDFQGAMKSGFFTALSGARTKAGFSKPRESPARFAYSQKYETSMEHVIEQNHELAVQALGQLGVSTLPLPAPQLPRDPAGEAWAEAEIQRLGVASFAIMNPGAGWGAKQWPAQRYGQVAQALARHNIKTLVNTGPGEESLAQEIIGASGGNAFEVHCSIGQLISLMRRARLFIGGDTGPLHLAASLDIPAVALYGPTDPKRTGPFGAKSVVIRHPESHTTMSHNSVPEEGLLKITADEVVSAARWLLGGGRG
ncbi:MAG TPA: glycosyltransferase family 9 protein [Candidatus Angelobacter sp.]|nr:glycosyltransferase family 9 protein [Candidatus Angelobacter sp.]